MNKLLQCLRTILEQALSDGLLAENRALAVKPVRPKTVEQEILSLKEVASLCDRKVWDDERYRAINLIAT